MFPAADEPGREAAAAARTDAWSDYWAGGALHSCAGSFAGNYAGALRRHFEAAFAQAGAGARVLDLCCGNAPLAQLWLDAGGADGAGRFDAVDAARVAPAWLAQRQPGERARVAVHGGVDAAHLPFGDAQFDLVLSQYGVEYVGQVALAEAARVLRPDGRFVAVLHHADALPVRIAREELAHHAWLREAGLLECAAGMLEPMARAATGAGRAALRGDAAAQAARSRFNAALLALEGRARASRWPDLLLEARDAVAAALERARSSGAGAGAAELAAARTGLARGELRQRELVESALDAAGVAALLAPLGDADAVVAPLRFDNGEIAGWGVAARRR